MKVGKPFFSAGSGKIQKISGGQKMKKVDFGGQNDLKKKILSDSEVFGT